MCWASSWRWCRPSRRRTSIGSRPTASASSIGIGRPRRPRSAAPAPPDQLSPVERGPSRALGLSLCARPLPLPHDPDRASRRTGARQGRRPSSSGPGVALARADAQSTSWRCSRRPIGWHRSGSSAASASAVTSRAGPSHRPGLGRLHRADRGHDDHDGDDASTSTCRRSRVPPTALGSSLTRRSSR